MIFITKTACVIQLNYNFHKNHQDFSDCHILNMVNKVIYPVGYIITQKVSPLYAVSPVAAHLLAVCVR